MTSTSTSLSDKAFATRNPSLKPKRLGLGLILPPSTAAVGSIALKGSRPTGVMEITPTNIDDFLPACRFIRTSPNSFKLCYYQREIIFNWKAKNNFTDSDLLVMDNCRKIKTNFDKDEYKFKMNSIPENYEQFLTKIYHVIKHIINTQCVPVELNKSPIDNNQHRYLKLSPMAIGKHRMYSLDHYETNTGLQRKSYHINGHQDDAEGIVYRFKIPNLNFNLSNLTVRNKTLRFNYLTAVSIEVKETNFHTYNVPV
jgi:hypothetical protein